MNVKTCSICGNKLTKNGKTKNGKQRGFCKKCRFSKTQRNSSETQKLKNFLSGLLSKNAQIDLKVNDRTFRRRNEKFGTYGALPEYVDEIHDVVYCDGIHLSSKLVVLIACNDKYVLSGYLARSESSRSGKALMSSVAQPRFVVTDGGKGFESAVKSTGPDTIIQRCTFHIFSQIRRLTTLNPKLHAGQEMLNLARALLKVKSYDESNEGKDSYISGMLRGDEFLKERSRNEQGRMEYKHKRLRSARWSLNKVLKNGTLFAYVNPLLDIDKPPATNNVIEGMVNAQLRAMLRNHRGLSSIKRAKACFWWCYMHSESNLKYSEMLKRFPTDDNIDQIYNAIDPERRRNSDIQRGGDGIVGNEFHTSTRYPFDNY